MKKYLPLFLFLALLQEVTYAQHADSIMVSDSAKRVDSVMVPDSAREKEWWVNISANLQVFYHLLFISPTVAFDYRWFHIEARYNSEAFQTGSIWTGYNFSVGEKVMFDATPMVGVLFGQYGGLAPGLGLNLAYKRFNLSSEIAYVFFAFGEKTSNYFYISTDVTYAPTYWMYFGLSLSRNRDYESNLDVQRGIELGFTAGPVTFTGYFYNLFFDRPFGTLNISVTF